MVVGARRAFDDWNQCEFTVMIVLHDEEGGECKYEKRGKRLKNRTTQAESVWRQSKVDTKV